jgi:hypothetical protein
MANWGVVLPIALLALGAIPFLIESRCRLRVICAVFGFISGITILLANVAPEVHIWTRPVQLLVLGFGILTILWIEQRNLHGERTGGLLAMHSLTFLYGVSLRSGTTSPWFWLAALICVGVASAAFLRLPAKLPLRFSLSLWLSLVLTSLVIWQIGNALSEHGLMVVTSNRDLGVDGAIQITQLIRSGTEQILFGGSIAFLALSILTALQSGWRIGSELITSGSLKGSSYGVGPALDRRFPIPGAIAVLILHGLPLIVLRCFHPAVSETMVFNISLAASPLFITGLLRRTGWGGLREVPLQDETALDLMRRSTLHRNRISQRRAS